MPVDIPSLVDALDDLGFDASDIEAKVMDRLASYCEMFSQDEWAITAKYMAFALKNKDLPRVPDLEAMDRFERSLREEEVERKKKGISGGKSVTAEVEKKGIKNEELDTHIAGCYGVKVRTNNREFLKLIMSIPSLCSLGLLQAADDPRTREAQQERIEQFHYGLSGKLRFSALSNGREIFCPEEPRHRRPLPQQ